MRIERHGTGPRFFFGLHGWSGDRHTFDPLLAGAPEDISFFSADLPGCGDSPAPSEWSMHAVAREVAEGVRALHQPVTLVGNCSGANIGFFVAQQIPDCIERMVTIDAFARWPWYFRIFVHPQIGRYAYYSTFENPVGRWLTNLSLSDKRQKETSLTEGFTRVDHRATYRYLILLRDAGDAAQFRGFAMPIDITYGERSFQAVKDSARDFSAIWPQARATSLANAGHLPILEASSALRNILFHPQSDQLRGPLCTKQAATYAQ